MCLPRALPFPQRSYLLHDCCALFCPILSVLHGPVLWSSRSYLCSQHFSRPDHMELSSPGSDVISLWVLWLLYPTIFWFLIWPMPDWMLIPYLHVSWNLSQSLSPSHIVGMVYGWFYLLPFWICEVLEKMSRDLNLSSHHHSMGTTIIFMVK